MVWKNYLAENISIRSYRSKDGHELFYRVIGKGHPVVLLHGFGMNNSHWLPFVLNQRGNYQFFIPDLRGFGASRNAYECYDDVLGKHASDTNELIEHLGLNACTLMGYSLGGLTTLNYIQKYGDRRLSNVVLVDIMPKLNPDETWRWSIFGDNGEKRLRSWRRITNRVLSEVGELASGVVFDDLSDRSRFHMIRTLGHFMADATSRSWVKAILRRASYSKAIMDRMFPLDYWHVFMDHAKSFVHHDYDFREALKGLEAPGSVIAAAKSHIFPCESQIQMAQMMPKGEIDLLLRSGHVLMLDEPLNFYEAMKRGIGRHSESVKPTPAMLEELPV